MKNQIIVKWCLKFIQKRCSIFFICACNNGEAFIGLQGQKEILDACLQELLKNGTSAKEWFMDGVVKYLDKYQSEKQVFLDKLKEMENA